MKNKLEDKITTNKSFTAFFEFSMVVCDVLFFFENLNRQLTDLFLE